MFYISIDGQIKHKEYLYTYTEQVLNHFFKSGLKRDVDVNIVFKRHLNGLGGLCHGDYTEVDIDVAKGELRKSADGVESYLKYDYEHIVLCLTHELVHAKQFIRKELLPEASGWHGKNLMLDKTHQYYKTPWEAEAYDMEKQLLSIYFKRIK